MEYNNISKTFKKSLNIINIDKQIIQIVCYNINNEINIPFMQIMLEKTLVNDLTLPFITIKDFISNEDINEIIINKIKLNLNTIIGNEKNINKNSIIFDGYFIDKKNDNYIAFVNISNIDIKYLTVTNNDKIYFTLISEIINYKKFYNTIKINKNTINFFISNIDLFLLYKDENNINSYNIPDVCYTIDEIDKCKFKLIFGQTPIYNNYYFYSSINNCFKYIDNNKKNGIVRYAIFYNENNIINNFDYDIVLSNYDDFVPLSYHKIFLTSLDN
jgi:hypothetical protein